MIFSDIKFIKRKKILVMDYKETIDQAILCQIGQKLRRARLDADIGQDELAHQTGLSRKTIQNAEAGNNYSMETLIRILRSLNITHFLDSFLPVVPCEEHANSFQDQQGRKNHQERQRASSRCAEEPNLAKSPH